MNKIFFLISLIFLLGCNSPPIINPPNPVILTNNSGVMLKTNGISIFYLSIPNKETLEFLNDCGAQKINNTNYFIAGKIDTKAKKDAITYSLVFGAKIEAK